MSDKPPFNLVDHFEINPAFRTTTPAPAEPRRGDRWRTIGHWLRDTGLGAFGFALVLTVAGAGWSASFLGLHDFGEHHMGLTHTTAWLVPITFDGAPAGLSIVVARASIHGRTAPLWRFLIVAFTGLSSWINYQHIDDPLGRIVAAFMPPSAVVLFEGLMSEVRAAAVRRTGRERPRLHPLRWFMDRPGTWAIYRAYVLGIELPDALQVAAGEVAAGAVLATESTTPNTDSGTPPGASPEPSTGDSSPADAPTTGATPEPTPVASTTDNKTAIAPAKKPPGRRQKTPRPAAKKAPRRRSLDEWVDVAGPVFHAEFQRLRHNPTAHEFATAIKAAGLGTVSDSTAKNIRAEILDRAELPSLDQES
jgi:hypothetical protein